jgi:putative transcriptional regulator
MTTERTAIGQEIETALGEVAAHVRGEAALPCRIVDDPAAERVVALRKRLKLSRQKFADRFGLDVRAVQEWEQGRRIPDRAARVLLTVIDRDPESVVRALTAEETGTAKAQVPAP